MKRKLEEVYNQIDPCTKSDVNQDYESHIGRDHEDGDSRPNLTELIVEGDDINKIPDTANLESMKKENSRVTASHTLSNNNDKDDTNQINATDEYHLAAGGPYPIDDPPVNVTRKIGAPLMPLNQNQPQSQPEIQDEYESMKAAGGPMSSFAKFRKKVTYANTNVNTNTNTNTYTNMNTNTNMNGNTNESEVTDKNLIRHNLVPSTTTSSTSLVSSRFASLRKIGTEEKGDIFDNNQDNNRIGNNHVNSRTTGITTTITAADEKNNDDNDIFSSLENKQGRTTDLRDNIKPNTQKLNGDSEKEGKYGIQKKESNESGHPSQKKVERTKSGKGKSLFNNFISNLRIKPGGGDHDKVSNLPTSTTNNNTAAISSSSSSSSSSSMRHLPLGHALPPSSTSSSSSSLITKAEQQVSALALSLSSASAFPGLLVYSGGRSESEKLQVLKQEEITPVLDTSLKDHLIIESNYPLPLIFSNHFHFHFQVNAGNNMKSYQERRRKYGNSNKNNNDSASNNKNKNIKGRKAKQIKSQIVQDLQYYTFPAYGKGQVLLSASLYQSLRFNNILSLDKAQQDVKDLYNAIFSWERSFQFIYTKYRVQLESFNQQIQQDYENGDDSSSQLQDRDGDINVDIDLVKEVEKLKSFEFYIQYYEDFCIHFSFGWPKRMEAAIDYFNKHDIDGNDFRENADHCDDDDCIDETSSESNSNNSKNNNNNIDNNNHYHDDKVARNSSGQGTKKRRYETERENEISRERERKIIISSSEMIGFPKVCVTTSAKKNSLFQKKLQENSIQYHEIITYDYSLLSTSSSSRLQSRRERKDFNGNISSIGGLGNNLRRLKNKNHLALLSSNSSFSRSEDQYLPRRNDLNQTNSKCKVVLLEILPKKVHNFFDFLLDLNNLFTVASTVGNQKVVLPRILAYQPFTNSHTNQLQVYYNKEITYPKSSSSALPQSLNSDSTLNRILNPPPVKRETYNGVTTASTSSSLPSSSSFSSPLQPLSNLIARKDRDRSKEKTANAHMNSNHVKTEMVKRYVCKIRGIILPYTMNFILSSLQIHSNQINTALEQYLTNNSNSEQQYHQHPHKQYHDPPFPLKGSYCMWNIKGETIQNTWLFNTNYEIYTPAQTASLKTATTVTAATAKEVEMERDRENRERYHRKQNKEESNRNTKLTLKEMSWQPKRKAYACVHF